MPPRGIVAPVLAAVVGELALLGDHLRPMAEAIPQAAKALSFVALGVQGVG